MAENKKEFKTYIVDLPFNLSNQIYDFGKKLNVEDVKEFIRLLKEVSEENDWEVAINDGYKAEGFRIISGKEYIDKLAGDKLNKTMESSCEGFDGN